MTIEKVHFGFVEEWNFDKGLKIHKGFKVKDASKWNGWLVPYVTKDVRDQIIASLDITNSDLWDEESRQDWQEYIAEEPIILNPYGGSGLYCVGYGLCWDEIDLNDLTEAYKDFCKKENIPCVDAQEYLFDPSKLTEKQHDWIKGFSKAWEGLSA
tara:strand:+ start:568 stop:1032 length:465 start_codon:yes stop_codon:yes gene_type:complete